MEQQLATETQTEIQTEPVVNRPAPSLLETWASNERMRHIPTVEWLVWKVDVDLRVRIDKLLTPFEALPADASMRPPIESDLRALCRALDRLADVARHTRTNGYQPNDLPGRVRSALNAAVGNLKTLDATLFGRRFPFHTFERSKGEPLYGALLIAIDCTGRLVSRLRAIDADLWSAAATPPLFPTT